MRQFLRRARASKKSPQHRKQQGRRLARPYPHIALTFLPDGRWQPKEGTVDHIIVRLRKCHSGMEGKPEPSRIAKQDLFSATIRFTRQNTQSELRSADIGTFLIRLPFIQQGATECLFSRAERRMLVPSPRRSVGALLAQWTRL